MGERFELGSEAWIDVARAYLEETIPPIAERLGGLTYSLCEVLTDAPAHLRQEDTDHVAWHAAFDGTTVTVAAGELTGASYRMRADYQSTLPMARLHFTDEIAAEVRERRRAAVSRGEVPDIPSELSDAFIAFHNHMAAHTR